MLLHSLTNTAEDDALLTEFLLEGSLHRHRVHDGIYSGTAQSQTLLQRNTEFVECFLQLRINLLVFWLLCQRVGIV
ncbi:Uncharacterised protein [Segatella copri]|nr:Uncharacterised protein [Segatella copri]